MPLIRPKKILLQIDFKQIKEFVPKGVTTSPTRINTILRRFNMNQHKSDTSQRPSTKNQHGSNTSQHKSNISQHESIRPKIIMSIHGTIIRTEKTCKKIPL